MRAVVQRVDSAAVEVEGAMVGSVGKGLLVLLGVEKEDTDRDLEYLLIMKNLWPEHGRRGLASAPGSFRRICL